MALDPKRRAGWILDLLLRAICTDMDLNLCIEREQFNRWAAIIVDLLETTDPDQPPPPPKSETH